MNVWMDELMFKDTLPILTQLLQVSQEKCQVVVDYLASGRQEANRSHSPKI